jgi:hypothetical protein
MLNPMTTAPAPEQHMPDATHAVYMVTWDLMRPATLVPVLPQRAQRVVDGATRRPDGCLISPLTPSRRDGRPSVEIVGRKQVMAHRVVMAAHLGRPILPTEDVHHTCEVRRCVEVAHLVVMSMGAHSAHHAEQQRREACPTHGIPWTSRDARGWGVCAMCGRERTARYRQRHPEKTEEYRRSEAGRESQRKASRKYNQTPEAKAKAALRQRERRARLRLAAS